MKAKEKKDIILRLLSERTYNLPDDYSVSIEHIKFDWLEIHVDDYRLTFYPNHKSRWMAEAVTTILTTIQATRCNACIECKNGVPVIHTIITDDY